MSDILKVLNDKQREGVIAPLGPVLVLAGAGSGKTRVLTYRIAHLIREKIFKPDEILALTFTNKAAGEMRSRIELLLRSQKSEVRGQTAEVGFRFLQSDIRHPTSEFRNITMGTFHSVCARILRREIEFLTRPSPSGRGERGEGHDRNFTIYDEDDALKILKQILIEKHLADKFRPQVFKHYISQAKNRLSRPAELVADNSFFLETVQEIYEEYGRRLRQSNALDFDDLLSLTHRLFSEVPETLKRYQKKFQYVLVDEYQDTNHVQYELLKLMVEPHKNLFVVGDDAQSIYGFRGANMRNILNFKNDFPKAQVIMLEQNYRSTQNILDAAGKVISLNPLQYEKTLWTKNSSGEKIGLYEALDEIDESEFVIQRIMNGANSPPREGELEGVVVDYDLPQAPPHEEGSEDTPILDQFFKSSNSRPISAIRPPPSAIRHLNLNDFVVLYRTHAQSRPFEERLLEAGIPYQIVGGIKFYERKEVKDVLAYARLVLNPRDLVSLARVINIPARGIGQISFKQIVKALSKYDFSFQRLINNLEREEFQAKALGGAKEFFDLLARGSKLPKTRNLLELMELLLTRSGYKDSLLDGSPEGEARWENIEELFNAAAKYKRDPWDQGLKSFLEEAALMTDLDAADDLGNKLTLMTLHSAKGLEYEVVFFVGLEEGLLPHSRSLDSPEELSEEVRLAYVGMTRAKKNLYLSYARSRQTYGELRRSVPSRILKAIPKALINKISNF